MIVVRDDRPALEVTVRHDVLRIEPWGADSFRVRFGQHRIIDDLPGALVSPKPHDATVTTDETTGRISNGALTAIVELTEGDTGLDSLLRFVRTDSARQVDYWVTTGDRPATILSNYADATGHAPMLPEWASGFWQSKLRYRDQAELLAVAREHKRRGLPLSVIVVDFFHWTHLGDWRFDPAEWPDPAAMVRELADRGVGVMVSWCPS